MKTRIMYLSLSCMVAVFAIFNISVSETKNEKKYQFSIHYYN